MENTGQGIKDDQDLSDEKFKDLIKDRWCHFWDLHDIMGERSCMQQVFASDELDDDDNSGIHLGTNDDNSTSSGSSVASLAVDDEIVDSENEVTTPSTPSQTADNSTMVQESEEPFSSPI
jgi:hypothetical protein